MQVEWTRVIISVVRTGYCARSENNQSSQPCLEKRSEKRATRFSRWVAQSAHRPGHGLVLPYAVFLTRGGLI